MNLDFGILWIEDSFSAEEEENLRRRVRDAGRWGHAARSRGLPLEHACRRAPRERLAITVAVRPEHADPDHRSAIGAAPGLRR